MVKAVRMHLLPSGTHALQFEDTDPPQPSFNEVEVRHTAILATSLDTQLAKQFASADPDGAPVIPGFSAAGVITELGSSVVSYQVGQRVAYCSFPTCNNKTLRDFAAAPLGGYCETKVVPIKQLIPLPDYVSDKVAASVLFLGLVARMLTKKVVSLKEEEVVLVHPAVGELGSLVCQWAMHRGAFVIGTVRSSDSKEKAEASRCHTLILFEDEQVLARKVKELSGGKGISVVYDLIGKTTAKRSLDCLVPKGLYINVTEELGKGACLHSKGFAESGTLLVTIPQIGDHVSSHEDLAEGVLELFEMLKSGEVQGSVSREYPLELAAQALEGLAAKNAIGTSILVPPLPDPRKIPGAS